MRKFSSYIAFNKAINGQTDIKHEKEKKHTLHSSMRMNHSLQTIVDSYFMFKCGNFLRASTLFFFGYNLQPLFSLPSNIACKSASCSSSVPSSRPDAQGQSRGLRCCPWPQRPINCFLFSSLSASVKKAQHASCMLLVNVPACWHLLSGFKSFACSEMDRYIYIWHLTPANLTTVTLLRDIIKEVVFEQGVGWMAVDGVMLS